MILFYYKETDSKDGQKSLANKKLGKWSNEKLHI